MKNLLFILFFLSATSIVQGQKSLIKAGAYLNADIADHKLGNINYPSFEVTFERLLRNNFSINCSYNYAKREYDHSGYGEGPQIFYFNLHTSINYDQSIILEGRYYLKSNSVGIFFQAGIPFTYSIERSYYAIPLPGEAPKYVYSYAISTFGGVGIKYPFTNRLGIEMNIAVSPSLNFLDVDYGTSGFIKSGIKIFFALDKVPRKTNQ